MSKDSPLQPRHRSSGPPNLPARSSTLVSPARRADALPAASHGCSQLIQELQDLEISQDLRDTAVGGFSPPDRGAGRSSGTLLEPSLRRNPLLIVATQEEA